MQDSRRLYRKLLRTATKLRVGPVQRKLKYNIRQVFDLYRLEDSPSHLAQLHKDAKAAVLVIEWFHTLHKACVLSGCFHPLGYFCNFFLLEAALELTCVSVLQADFTRLFSLYLSK